MTYSVHCAVAAVRCIDGRHVDTSLIQTHLSYITAMFTEFNEVTSITIFTDGLTEHRLSGSATCHSLSLINDLHYLCEFPDPS